MGNTWLYALFLFSSVISGYVNGHRKANGPDDPRQPHGQKHAKQAGSPKGTEGRVGDQNISAGSLETLAEPEQQVLNRATVTLNPNWPLIYKGEGVFVRCEIPGGEGRKWTFEWRPTRLNDPKTSQEYIIILSAKESDSGEYSCRGTSGDESTDWSDVVVLTVYELSVSPSWLSPGASVTLSCQVEPSPSGTRFFWYKAVPDPTRRFYSYELLPGSSDGTDENFYIVHGLNNTAGYVCEAGRGKPNYRDPSFVFSADPGSAASLSVNPDRVQHFRSDSVSLSCEGNFTEWRVRRFAERKSLSDCSIWGKMNGSTCVVSLLLDSGVFWCESGSGEFSNAVNISAPGDYDAPLLVSPVHPVTEGNPVTLSCRDTNQNRLSKVFFYHNNKLLHNDSREELNIFAVSKSDEGFYKCKHSGKESPRSWMSVRVTAPHPVSSSFPVLLIVGPVVGFVLIILLLLLCCCRRFKGLWCIRSKQSEGRGQTSNTSDAADHEHRPPPHDNANPYASVKTSEATGNAADESTEVTYSRIELKDIDRTRRPREAEEGAVYSEVKLQQ